jgi:endonuclease/exonuclease/phosphatase family metal-dependent hydrolase
MGGIDLVVATFNVHAGMDGYGRRYDLVAACKEIGADVLVLQEVFAPGEGVSQAQEIARDLGYHRFELPLSHSFRTRRAVPGAPADEWEPRRPYPRVARALRVGRSRRRTRPKEGYEEGSWGIAVLTRQEAARFDSIELGRLRRDFTRRAALVVELACGLTVVGTHMAHFSHGSPLLYARLRKALPDPEQPALLAGDMNFWGPPVELALPGWRRAVKAKTWPARRPRHQLDHLLVTRPVEVLDGSALGAGNSDHLPLRARISFNT